MDNGTYSVERLVHFQCGSCKKWWSIGDAPDRDYWYCPWCGARQWVIENPKEEQLGDKAVVV